MCLHLYSEHRALTVYGTWETLVVYFLESSHNLNSRARCVRGVGIMREIEVKLRVENPEEVEDRLRGAGAMLREAHVEEVDRIFRDVNGDRLEGQLLRLRTSAGKNTLTWKGVPKFKGGVKERDEEQTGVESAEAMIEILRRLGFEVDLEFSKVRNYWELEGCVVSLDRLPFGTYVEIEGEELSIKKVRRLLGLESVEEVRLSYPEMARRYLRK